MECTLTLQHTFSGGNADCKMVKQKEGPNAHYGLSIMNNQ